MFRLTPCVFVAVANAALHAKKHHTWQHDGTDFVQHVGLTSHMDFQSTRSQWPLPNVSDCDQLSRVAAEKRILSVQTPYSGEIFLLYSRQLRRFVKTGIVAWRMRTATYHRSGLTYHECVTIESRPHNAGVCQVPSKLSPESGDRFVRWADLDGRAAWGHASDRDVSDLERCVARMQPAQTPVEPVALPGVRLERAA
jgi:hypothetical protein